MSNMNDMNNELEKFVKDNRDEFDEVPVPVGLWDKIEQQIQSQKPVNRSLSTGGKSPVIKMGWMKMAAAAAVIVAVGLITFIILNNKPVENGINTAKGETKPTTTDTVKQPLIAQQTPAAENNKEDQTTIVANENTQQPERTYESETDNELFHFTKLIKIKQKQLLTIKNDSPELYEHFVTDYKKLDASYNELQEEMKTNPNKEVLLEKMIVNLQLQIELLNEQLKVVRQLNKLKKDKANEISKTM
jgi:hypothetical protein